MESARQDSRLPQDRRSGLVRASAARRARRAAHRMCAVQFALIRGLGPSFSLNMTGTSKQELKMHAQAKPERPKGEGHGWPEFYSPQMRNEPQVDIEFSLSRISAAQTPCLAQGDAWMGAQRKFIGAKHLTRIIRGASDLLVSCHTTLCLRGPLAPSCAFVSPARIHGRARGTRIL